MKTDLHAERDQTEVLRTLEEKDIKDTRGQGAKPVMVKGGMSLRNSLWHGLQNDIIMCDVKYGKWRKEIN